MQAVCLCYMELPVLDGVADLSWRWLGGRLGCWLLECRFHSLDTDVFPHCFKLCEPVGQAAGAEGSYCTVYFWLTVQRHSVPQSRMNSSYQEFGFLCLTVPSIILPPECFPYHRIKACSVASCPHSTEERYREGWFSELLKSLWTHGPDTQHSVFSGCFLGCLLVLLGP